MKTRTLLFISLLAASTLLTGCAGMILNAMAPSARAGKTYSEIAPTLPQPSNDQGRLVVYRTPTSSSTDFHVGVGFTGKFIQCTINADAYELYWEIFAYRELSAGTHSMTCGRIRHGAPFGMSTHHYGEKAVSFEVASGETVYVRIDVVDGKPTPVRVQATTANAELSSLKMQPDFKPFAKVDQP